MMLTLGLMSFSLLCSFFTKNNKVEQDKESSKATTNEPFYKYMYDKRVLLPCILVALNYVAIAGTVNFIGAFGKEIGVGGRISQFFIAQGIAMVIIRAFSGKIFDRFGHQTSYYSCRYFRGCRLGSFRLLHYDVDGFGFRGVIRNRFCHHSSNNSSLGVTACSS